MPVWCSEECIARGDGKGKTLNWVRIFGLPLFCVDFFLGEFGFHFPEASGAEAVVMMFRYIRALLLADADSGALAVGDVSGFTFEDIATS